MKFFRDHGLSIVLIVLFLLFQAGLTRAGRQEYNEEQLEHGKSHITLSDYLRTGAYWEATTENRESEFLQMFLFLLFTSFLYQRGSAQSKDPDKREQVDIDPRNVKIKDDTPGPVKKGGFLLVLYEYSLTIVFALLFIISFVRHAISGAREYSEQQLQHGGAPMTRTQFIGQPEFRYQSLQNRQSEFLALAAMVILSIRLRHRGSSESKPVHESHSKTGH